MIRERARPVGAFVTLEGESFYRIAGYDQMQPFLMSLASDVDLWMFVTSGGGLTAGRVDAAGSLFPYETVDKLYDAHHHTGPITLIRVRRKDRDVLWQPFANFGEAGEGIERNLYKNILGSRLVFEEIHHELRLAFRYRWAAADTFGWIRTATLENTGNAAASISLLDGLRNVLPFGAPLALYQQSSSLIEAYKRSDLDGDTRLGLFSLTARVVDRAEAAEELRANIVWLHGLENSRVLLSGEAIGEFRRGEVLTESVVLKGRRGNYLAAASLSLGKAEAARWDMATDAGLSHVEIANLHKRLGESNGLESEIEEALRGASDNLMRSVASADGLQLTANAETSFHHLANVLFNNMRGGVFAHGHDVPTPDLRDFLNTRNRNVARRHRGLLDGLSESVSVEDLRATAEKTRDADFQRLVHEYLPLHFGRRHGDPSRPWNRFAIHLKNPDGSRALSYQGNWRDIFQNWEALSYSFPCFLSHFVAKFVNASTVDGFNPYRITRDGIDWEVDDPEDPWSYIGYWGDHQIIYLLKFLEAMPRFHPGTLENLLRWEIFSYANVPYRLRPYEEILADPHNTIDFDSKLAKRIDERVADLGTDGKLLLHEDGSVVHVNLAEKLLVPALSKLSNLVPDGGIWMNTQRPEWNDANNALAGYGLSVVTLCYLRRYLRFVQRLLRKARPAEAKRRERNGPNSVGISTEVAVWMRNLADVFQQRRSLLESSRLSPTERKELMDALGQAFSAYRQKVYASGFSGKETVPLEEVASFCERALEYVDHTIEANQRKDGLYHSYNLLHVGNKGREVDVRRLYEMLEGQVAVLSSGLVKPVDAVGLLTRMFEGRLYREDQKSFLLYPQRDLPAFLQKNVVPEAQVLDIGLLTQLLQANEFAVVQKDAKGVFRFHGDFSNATDVGAALDRLATNSQWHEAVARDRDKVLALFESVFAHRAFTGRSGTMYGFEGLGCVYWHMVAKLLLAIQEIALTARREEGEDSPAWSQLVALYYEVRAGLGFEKSAAEYGAFPTDPYSHTPPHGGAQQPGMTGQVKEEILTRWGELGVTVENGIVAFQPCMLRETEFLSEDRPYRFYDVSGNESALVVPTGSLAFSFCQTPVVYELADHASVRIVSADGTILPGGDDRLDSEWSDALLQRSGRIARIEVGVARAALYSNTMSSR